MPTRSDLMRIIRLTLTLSALTAACYAEPPNTPRPAAERKQGEAYRETLEKMSMVDDQGHAATGPLEIDMVWIPPGRFVMGSTQRPEEQPAHEAEIDGFWMAKFEFTRDLWYGWVESRPRGPDTIESAIEADVPFAYPYRNPDFKDRHHVPKLPFTGITSQGAQAFCRWLTARTGRYYRLPSEAEWEYAARAGARTPWSFGDSRAKLPDYAWFGEPRAQGLHTVGLKRPNAWGLYDMHGNAAEWVLDRWTDDYTQWKSKPTANPRTDRGAGNFGVARGGDWTSDAQDTRASARRKVDCRPLVVEDLPYWYDTSDAGRMIGFRIVSTPKPDSNPQENLTQPHEQRLRDEPDLENSSATKPSNPHGTTSPTKR
jgi:formylglycine-generating enzyme required for sulfatase activity